MHLSPTNILWTLLSTYTLYESHHCYFVVLGLHQNNIDIHLIQYPWVILMTVKMKQESWHKDQTQKFQQWMVLIIMMSLQGTPALEWILDRFLACLQPLYLLFKVHRECVVENENCRGFIDHQHEGLVKVKQHLSIGY